MSSRVKVLPSKVRFKLPEHLTKYYDVRFFYVYDEDGTIQTTCMLFKKGTDKIMAEGSSFKVPRDQWDKAYGRFIACRRALHCIIHPLRKVRKSGNRTYYQFIGD